MRDVARVCARLSLATDQEACYKPPLVVAREISAAAMFDKGNIRVNKSQLIDKIADGADISKAAAGRALDAFIDAVGEALKEGDQVALVGFWYFRRSRACSPFRPQPANWCDHRNRCR